MPFDFYEKGGITYTETNVRGGNRENRDENPGCWLVASDSASKLYRGETAETHKLPRRASIYGIIYTYLRAHIPPFLNHSF